MLVAIMYSHCVTLRTLLQKLCNDYHPTQDTLNWPQFILYKVFGLEYLVTIDRQSIANIPYPQQNLRDFDSF